MSKDRPAKSLMAKALEINLNQQIYGSLAEIGAGQEVAATFFKAGAASGSVAKSMSAYDMTFSDSIYGKEKSGRYVCQDRLIKMLDKEFSLLEKRLSGVRSDNTLYFAFANTVATKGMNTQRDGHGWLGVRFQTRAGGPINDLILHVNLYENENVLQQEAIGILGTNMIYACFHNIKDEDLLIQSLFDHLNIWRISIDFIQLNGEDFEHIDNRILSLKLVKYGLSQSVMFDKDGKVVQPSDLLHKKNIMVLRGSFRPPTHVNIDMLDGALKQFEEEKDLSDKGIIALCEITLSNLKNQANLDEEDFLARVDLLGALGQYCMISNYSEYHRLSTYLSKFTQELIVFALGIDNLKHLFEEKYYENLNGGIMEAMGRLFSHKTKLYIYPARAKADHLITADICELPNSLIHLYDHLKSNDFINDYKYVNHKFLHIFSRQVLEKIKNGEPGWQECVPKKVELAVAQHCLFGYPCPPLKNKRLT